MEQGTIVPQIQFKTLEDFIEDQNNYYAHFLRGNRWGETRRNRPYFIRFRDLYPEMEKELADRVTEARSIRGKKKVLPYAELWESYNLMSQLVYSEDRGVMNYKEPSMYLIS